ncbi:hypothetical protein HMSSN036_66810 [Paenibacillus macerans]|nr:hypothetical protein HMSSN036_66810 [Paenibacillus macerans]
MAGTAALAEVSPRGTETGSKAQGKAQAETKPWLIAEAVAKEQAESRAWAIAARAKAGAGAGGRAKAEVEADVDTEIEDEASVPYQLVRVENELGQHIELHYDEQGFLQQVIDSVGRVLDITTDAAGRITKVTHVYRTNPDSPLSERREVLVQYQYNEAAI